MRFDALKWILLVLIALPWTASFTYGETRGYSPSYSDPNRDGGHEAAPGTYLRERMGYNLSDHSSRTHTEGISELKIWTRNPINVGIYTKLGNAVGTLELSTREMTDTAFDFVADGLEDETNIWDDRGRAVLVPGNLFCRVTMRTTLAQYHREGLSLGLQYFDVLPGVVQFTLATGGSYEELNSDYFEQTKKCPIGPVPAFTTIEKIKDLCKPCRDKVLPTLRQDVNSRMKNLSYMVKTPICQQDSECSREDSYWTKGRCVLVRDQNDSYYSECRSRSRIGGHCKGEGTNGFFEYPCDNGLTCVKVHEGKGLWNWTLRYDYSKYECRDPKNPSRLKPY